MITDEEMIQLVLSVADKNSGYPFDSNGEYVTLSMTELKSIYQLGRQHQRESDAALCDEFSNIEGIAQMCANAVRANTGELK